MTPRNIAFLASGAIALVTVGYLSGRKVEANNSKAGLTKVSSEALVPAHSKGPTPTAGTGIPSAAAAQPSASPMVVGDLFGRLAEERTGRLNKEPTADHIFETMKAKAGVEIEEQLQVAGWTINAKFCDKVRTTKDVHIVVCEFADEAAAIQGQKDGTTASLKRREVLRNKTTTCAVHQTGETPAAEAQATKVKALFLAM